MNNQPIEKRVRNSDGRTLNIVSVFPTLQGEGPFTGRRAIFVRLAGCNLQCPLCDTDYTTNRRNVSVSSIVETIQSLLPRVQSSYGASNPLVVITGGEPFRQRVAILANMLIELGFDVQIETNGTLAPEADLHHSVVIVCSPKAGGINPKLASRADCYKYVMSSDSVGDDGLPIFALDHSAKPCVARPPEGNTNPIYLQPADQKNIAQNHRNVAAVRDSCMRNGYILQLQVHKIVGVE